MLKNRKSDNDATLVRHGVAGDADEIIEHIINVALSMPYDVYSELFDAVDGLGVEIENLKSENAKLRELCAGMFKDFVSCDYELRARAGRTFMAFTRYALEFQELGIEVDK